jgi:hypothetical protein
MADSGYCGNPEVIIPYRKPCDGSEPPAWKQDYNTGHRKIRARVEHALARLKTYKILRDYRRGGRTLAVTARRNRPPSQHRPGRLIPETTARRRPYRVTRHPLGGDSRRLLGGRHRPRLAVATRFQEPRRDQGSLVGRLAAGDLIHLPRRWLEERPRESSGGGEFDPEAMRTVGDRLGRVEPGESAGAGHGVEGVEDEGQFESVCRPQPATGSR